MQGLETLPHLYRFLECQQANHLETPIKFPGAHDYPNDTPFKKRKRKDVHEHFPDDSDGEEAISVTLVGQSFLSFFFNSSSDLKTSNDTKYVRPILIK